MSEHSPISQPVPAVGTVVFHEGRILLVKRGKPPAESEWAIPGGRIHLGESLLKAAERELLEETGIQVRAGKVVHAFDLIEQDTLGNYRFHYVIVDIEASYIAGTPSAGDDAIEARWLTEDEVRTLPLNRFTRQLLCEKYHFLPECKS